MSTVAMISLFAILACPALLAHEPLRPTPATAPRNAAAATPSASRGLQAAGPVFVRIRGKQAGQGPGQRRKPACWKWRSKVKASVSRSRRIIPNETQSQ